MALAIRADELKQHYRQQEGRGGALEGSEYCARLMSRLGHAVDDVICGSTRLYQQGIHFRTKKNRLSERTRRSREEKGDQGTVSNREQTQEQENHGIRKQEGTVNQSGTTT